MFDEFQSYFSNLHWIKVLSILLSSSADKCLKIFYLPCTIIQKNASLLLFERLYFKLFIFIEINCLPELFVSKILIILYTPFSRTSYVKIIQVFLRRIQSWPIDPHRWCSKQNQNHCIGFLSIILQDREVHPFLMKDTQKSSISPCILRSSSVVDVSTNKSSNT